MMDKPRGLEQPELVLRVEAKHAFLSAALHIYQTE